MFANFPEFTKLNINDQAAYNTLFGKYPPIADFTFANLMIWLDQFDDLEISTLNSAIILKFTNLFMQGRLMLTLLCDHDTDRTIASLFDYQISQGMPCGILAVPDTVVASLKHPENFIITEERSNYEYILDTQKLSQLPGSEMGKLRRKVTAFKQHHPMYIVKQLDLNQAIVKAQLRHCLKQWGETNSQNDPNQDEARVIDKTLRYAKELGYKALGIYIDAQLQSFVLYQFPPQGSYAVANHTKSNKAYRHLFDFTVHCLATELNALGIPYINFEQDLGIPGLREHKLGLRPVRFFKKYSIRPAI